MDSPFQRKGAISNTYVSREFEIKAREFFAQQGISHWRLLNMACRFSRQHIPLRQ